MKYPIGTQVLVDSNVSHGKQFLAEVSSDPTDSGNYKVVVLDSKGLQYAKLGEELLVSPKRMHIVSSDDLFLTELYEGGR